MAEEVGRTVQRDSWRNKVFIFYCFSHELRPGSHSAQRFMSHAANGVSL